MGRIDNENAKILRQAMDVQVELESTKEKPTDLSATNIMAAYEVNARPTDAGSTVTLMDFCNGGFINDGAARPIQATALPLGQKYGYIASQLCDANGDLANPVVVSFDAEEYWPDVTLTLVDSKGNVSYEEFNPVVSGSGYAVTINSFKPNERLHVSKVSLGQLWVFDKTKLVSFSAQLRGANSVLDEGNFTFEGSEMEFEARVGADGDSYIELFGNMDKYSEIAWSCGYAEDMTAVRTFYLTEASYDSFKKTVNVKGCDATIAFLDEEYGGAYIESTYANVRQALYNKLKSLITGKGITPTETGTVPTGIGTTATSVFIDKDNIRSILAKATELYDSEDFQFIYRDGGRPEIIASGETDLYMIDEENTAEFTTSIEKAVNEYDSILTTSAISASMEVASQSDAVAGQTYFLSSSDPLYSVSTSGATLLDPYTIKLIAASSGTISVLGTKIINSTIAADNPKQVIDIYSKGIAVDLGTLPKIEYDGGSLTEKSMEALLTKTNLKYTFKWRGNPHIKPYDRIQMKRITTNNRYPTNRLYPADDLYPINGTTMIMRISSVSYSFENGGLVSEITARRVGDA